MAPKVVPIPETNAAKYFSHREAWGRIQRAIAHGFYLEAVTLEESVISDRLHSYFCKVGVIDAAKAQKFISLANLIRYLEEHEPEPIRVPLKNPRFEHLQKDLRVWKDDRNHVVHGIVRSAGDCHDDPLDFIRAAEEIARRGEQIAKAVNDWYRRFKDKQKTIARRTERSRRAEQGDGE